MYVPPKRPLFHRQSTSNVYRIFVWTLLILAGTWLISSMKTGGIQSPFKLTPTPTRTNFSFTIEGDAQFTAGKLDAAITAYREAARVNPDDAEMWAKLARIQTYSSSLRTTDAERRQRLQEALDSINTALELAPNDSNVHAIRAFVLDWSANPALAGDRVTALLIEAEQEAATALQMDSQNTLALAFYAEILVDQQKWTQGQSYIEQAVQRDPTLMDVHRVYAYVLESQGYYRQAIEEYNKAIEINPNLTFLYIAAGTNYRQLAFKAPTKEQSIPLYNLALEYYDKAARLNQQLEIKDPIPYIAIGKVYTQQGEFFSAALNMQKALSFDQSNPDMYGQLGMVFYKARNYEGSILTLKCAVRGCTPPESCDARGGCGADEFGVQVVGLPLSQTTVVYYYTYGSALAGLSRPKRNYCADALVVFQEVRVQFSKEPIIMGIVENGEAICASLGEPTQTFVPDTPFPTGQPGAIGTTAP
jgi:tetratricopeptide (TPR) repeat protein